MLDLKLDTRKSKDIRPWTMLPHRIVRCKHSPRTHAHRRSDETLKKKGIAIERFNLRDHP